MEPVRRLRERLGLTQSALAVAGRTSQPTIAAYEGGRKSPTVDTVRRLAAAVGLEAYVVYHPPLTREDRRSLALHRAVADRLLEAPEATLASARETLRRVMTRQEGASRLLREWEVILDRPPEEIIDVLLDPQPRARELRHVTPFAGLLTNEERSRVYRDFQARERRSGR